ncbi:LCP family protein [Niallia sp. NCCP-28]|uniref:LCP family protein n=1 Tax=Niallia sp. NCCP-28 TaxID=2934712 RepID=UPI0020861B54|nr:LCP family protein [Niallia sp. NCCP-28]GKU81715.1 LytR family transcriptional regulator [Niallia sp. NCCP-28]
MERTDYQKKRKKRRRLRKGRVFFVFLLMVLIVGAAYIYFQYKQGVKQSEEKGAISKVKYEFNGKEDAAGGTNVLLLGSDARKEDDKFRTDTIMIAQYHPDKGTYKILSLMRDMYVDIPGNGQGRINSAFTFGGPELLRQTIKENFDIDLQYYAIVNFEGFEALIDEAFPDGVEMDVEKKMSTNIGVTLEPGLQHLNGKQLLGYVRFRHDAISDFGRVERQQKTLKALASQISSVQTVAKLPKLAGVMIPYINTSMNTGDIIYIGKELITNKDVEIESMRIPVDGSYQDMRVNGAAVLSVDLEQNKQAIAEFLSN